MAVAVLWRVGYRLEVPLIESGIMLRRATWRMCAQYMWVAFLVPPLVRMAERGRARARPRVEGGSEGYSHESGWYEYRISMFEVSCVCRSSFVLCPG